MQALLPQLLCLSYGALVILCAGGIGDWSLWGTNQIGDIGLVYGLGATTPTVTRASHLALAPGGHRPSSSSPS
ncbi:MULTISPECIES: hypothetical protein [unclassified Streptomyces]|uniref:hypothetical protein n=1 Tax=unclassified Streptomyces TaxID=2593676 RepID=UPI00070FC690|nr:hypothetical protein [Streptomyces sp. Root1310]KQX82337.1 hypothetical protein ASD48_03310 [Streptomyces sp. Root1310]